MNFYKSNEFSIIAIALVLINLIVKALFISSNSLGGDEPFSVYIAQMDPYSIVSVLSTGNNPPLFELLLHFWIELFGISPLAVRIPSLLFSCITILYIFKLGHKFLNKRIGIYASVLFIFSNYHLLFAHEARVYSLLGLLSIMSMYYFMVVFDHCKHNSRNSILGSVIALLTVNILAVYAHYLGFFILLAQTFILFFYWKVFLNYWKQIGLSAAVLVLLYSPNIIVLLSRFEDYSTNGTWVNSPNGIESIYGMLRQFSNAPVVAVSVISVFILAIVFFLIRQKSRSINSFSPIVVYWFLLVFFGMFAISYKTPVFLDRYLMSAAIAYCLVIAIAADSIIESKRFRYVLPALICILFIATVKPNISNKRNLEQAVNEVQKIKDTNTLVLICPQYFTINFAYYYDQAIFKTVSPNGIYNAVDSLLRLENIYGVSDLQKIDLKNWDQVVFFDATSGVSAPSNEVRNVLKGQFYLNTDTKVYEIFSILHYKSK